MKRVEHEMGTEHGRLDDAAAKELADVLGDRLVRSQSVLEQHGRDESPLPAAPPEAVAFPLNAIEVSKVVKICARRRLPVVPFGAGTSLEGHVLATSGGLSLDLTRMNEIVATNVDDLDVTVQAGVTKKQLNAQLKKDGLFFPVDPGADATLGGMVATNASGTTTVRYGAMRENVLSLEVVLADGRIIRTGHRARKSSAGYDLTRLFIGSEGTLGVVTEVALRTYGIPEAISGAICHFPSVELAVRSVIAALQTGVPVARIEFMDEEAIRASNDYSQLDYPVAPTLLLEFHGSPDGVREQAKNVSDIVGDFEALGYRSAVDNQERTKLWRARHDSFYASLAMRPGARAVVTDVCVPISHLADCITEAKRDVQDLGVPATIVGHVGDGNFHVAVMIDPDSTEELSVVEGFNQRLVTKALAVGGTCTGEHGIGLRKMAFLPRELPGAVDVMRSIKRTLDPHNIMNPGKVLSLQPD